MNDLNLAIKITTEGGKVIVKDFTSLRDAADDAGKALNRADTAGTKAAAGLKQTGSSAKRAGSDIDTATTSVDKMLTSLKLLVGGVSFALLSREVKDYADTWKLANNQLRQVTDSETELMASRSQLLAVAKATNTELLGTIELYASFDRGTRELGLSQENVIGITKTMNNLLLAGGKSAQETSGAIRQLNQGLESGALRGDEFNSVAEGAPRVLDALAASLGIGRGELREFAATGGITAKILATALIEYKDTAQRMADITARTFDQQMNNATTNIVAFVGQSQFLNAAVDATGSGLVFLTENIEAFTYAIGTAGAVYAASYVPAIAAGIAKQYQMVVGTQMATAAEALHAEAQLATAASATAAARSEAALAATRVADLKSVIAQFEAEALLENNRLKAQITQQGRIATATRMAQLQTARIGIVKQLAAAEAQLVATTGVATGAAAVQSAATATLATAQTAATRTSYALGVATRFLLGPFGLLLTAFGLATAAFYLSAEASKADEEAKTKQAEAAEKLLTTFDALRASSPANFSEAYIAAQQKAIEIDKQKIELDKEMAALRKELASQYDPKLVLSDMQKVEDKLTALNAAAAENQKALDGMKQSFDNGITSLGAFKKPAEEVIKFTDGINKELQKLIDTIDPAGAALRQYGEDYDVLLAAYVDGNATYEQTLKYMGLLDKQYEAQRAKVEKVVDKNADYIASMTEQLELSKLVGKELAVQTALRKLDADATQPQIDKALELACALYDQAEALKASNDLDKFYQDAIDGVNGYSDAWASAGNVIIDTFGSIGQQMENLFVNQEAYTKAIEINQLKQQEVGADTKKLKTEEYKLNFANTQAQLNSYSSIAGAASKMFKENSKTAKLAHAVEQALAVASLGMSIQKMLMSSTETAVVVGNETVKQAALGTTAIITQGQGDPYSAFFRIAAMAALVAGLGIATSGSSSGGSIPTSEKVQAEQGTGSVLGSDDKSESLQNSFDRFEDIELDQLAELQGIRQSMRELNNGIAQLAKSFVTGLDFNGGSYDGQLGKFSTTSKLEGLLIGGGLDKLDPTGIISTIIGGFSSTKKDLVDSGITFLSQTLGDILDSGDVQADLYNTIKTTKKKFWGLSKSTKTSIEYSDLDSAISQQMADIFGFVGESIVGAADLLGFTSAADKLDSFKINLPQISFKDLSGEEIQAELEAIFSQQADLISTYLIPSIANYQQIGEGAYETLLRVAQEQAVFNDHLDRTGIILNGLSNIDLIDVSQNIIGLMGGLDAFKDASNTFFTEFFSEQEQFAYLQKSLSEVLATMNLSLPENREGFKDLVQGIDITTAEGQSLYATLLQVSGAAAEYYDQLEQTTGVIQDGTEALAKRAEYEASIADALARMDFTSLQASLFDLNLWYRDQIESAAALGADTALLETLYGRKRADVIEQALAAINTKIEAAMATLTSTHERAVSELNGNYEQLFSAIDAVSNTIASSVLELRRAMTGWNEVAYQAAEINRLKSELGAGDISQQTSTIEQLISVTMDKWRTELANNDAAISQTEQLISEHQSAVDSLASTYEQLFSAIRNVASGISSSIGEIQRSISGISDVDYQKSVIAGLRGQLGQGDIAEQTGTLDSLYQATMARYQAELSQHAELQQAADDRYNTELAQYQSLLKAVENLKNMADSLLIGELSYLSEGDQRDVAQQQYDDLLARAKGGDSEAASELASFSKQFLEVNKSYLGGTGSGQYGALFDKVQSDLRGFSAGAAPTAQAATQAYQTSNLAIQQNALAELTELQTLLDALNAEALAQQADESLSLESQLATLNNLLTEQQAIAEALSASTLAELTNLQSLLSDLNAQAITQQTNDLASLQATLDADLAALLATSASEINAINEMSNNIVAAINAIDIAPIVITAPAAPVVNQTPTATENKNNNNVADFSKDVTPKTQSNDDVVAAVKAVKDELVNVRRDLTKTNDLVYAQRRLA